MQRQAPLPELTRSAIPIVHLLSEARTGGLDRVVSLSAHGCAVGRANFRRSPVSVELGQACRSCRERLKSLVLSALTESPLRTLPKMTSGHLASCRVRFQRRSGQKGVQLIYSSLFVDIFLQYSGAKGDYAALDASISAYTNSSFLLSGYGARRGSKAFHVAAAEPLAAGPYFATLRGDEVSLYEAWRLYGDQERACESTLLRWMSAGHRS